jgi:hypothetical protein
MISDPRTQEEAALSLLEPVMPKTPEQQAREKYGTGGMIMRMLGTGLSGGLLGSVLIPETGRANRERYKEQLSAYKDSMADRYAQQTTLGHIRNLQDDVEGPEDALGRTYMMGLEGMGSIDRVEYALTGNRPGVKPEYVTVNNNGQVYFADKNNPNSPGIPATTPDGQPIRNRLDQWQVDNIGAFDRMVPRLETLDEMERNGMAIPRATMTQLRAYEALDSDGRNVIRATAFGEWMEKYLTPEQRRYILAAEDAGMIVLRDESGAAISASEILRQMNQYLMFDDLDAVTRKDQREARTRKAGTLMTGMPDYIKNDRQAQIDWVENYDGSLEFGQEVNQSVTTGNDKLPSMTAQEMSTYINLSKSHPVLAERFIELIRMQSDQTAGGGGV